MNYATQQLASYAAARAASYIKATSKDPRAIALVHIAALRANAARARSAALTSPYGEKEFLRTVEAIEEEILRCEKELERAK